MKSSDIYTKSELAFFRSLLEEKRKQALSSLSSVTKELLGVNQGLFRRFGSLEESPEVLSQEKLSGLLARHKHHLDHIEAALQRIEKDTFGICTLTGKPIAKARLLKVPHTKYCVGAKKI